MPVIIQIALPEPLLLGGQQRPRPKSVTSGPEAAHHPRQPRQEMNYGSGGIGTAAHIAGSTFIGVLRLRAVRMPHRGCRGTGAGPAGQPNLARSRSIWHRRAQGQQGPRAGGHGRAAPEHPRDVDFEGALQRGAVRAGESWGGLWVPVERRRPWSRVCTRPVKQTYNNDVELRASVVASGAELEPSSRPGPSAPSQRPRPPKWAKADPDGPM